MFKENNVVDFCIGDSVALKAAAKKKKKWTNIKTELRYAEFWVVLYNHYLITLFCTGTTHFYLETQKRYKRLISYVSDTEQINTQCLIFMIHHNSTKPFIKLSSWKN